MATVYYNLTGKIKWAKIHEHQKDTAFDANGVYTVDFYPQDEQTLKKITDSGIQIKRQVDADGTFFRFKRRHQEIFKGEIQVVGPPKATVKGQVVENLIIGNGSTATVSISVFDTRRGKGHRLISINVLDLVEYVKPTVGDAVLPPVEAEPVTQKKMFF